MMWSHYMGLSAAPSTSTSSSQSSFLTSPFPIPERQHHSDDYSSLISVSTQERGMGYLSCKAESSISTCRSISVVAKSTTADTTTVGSNHDEGHQYHRRIQQFTYRQMEEATSYFSEEYLLGRGSHGSVYKAQLPPSGRIVAVKRPSRIRNRHTPVRLVLTPSSAGSINTSFTSNMTGGGSRNEVENEIDVLSRIHGSRLVNLVGFTNSEPGEDSRANSLGFSGSFRKERLLVIEYMPNGTLFDLLHSNPRPPGWSRRLRLAVQTAKAIQSLHSHDPPVIHRDVKSANVLLDGGNNARLGDFGLAVFCDDSANVNGNIFGSMAPMSPFFRSTPPAGTLGYLDPGYVTPDNLSTKTDVFSFGILLLEIMSGRKAIDVQHSPPSIVEWAMPLMRKGKILALYDPRIAPPRDPVARRQLAALAASCVRSSRDRRPSMDEVVERLKVFSKTVPSKAWNSLTVGNPCSAVETEATRQPKHASVGSDCNSPGGSMDVAEEMTPVSSYNTPALAMTYGRTSRNGRRVFSEGGSSSRHLMEIIKGPNEEVIKIIRGDCASRRLESSVSRGRPLQFKETMLHTKRNLSLRDTFEAMSVLDKAVHLDGSVPAETTSLSFLQDG